jgi:Cu/Ag efflux pump CusA
MFIRFTMPTGVRVWIRADRVFSVEKQSENKIQTMIMLTPQNGYPAEEEQEAIVEALAEALKTGIPQVTKRDAQESPPGRLIG